MSNKLEKNFSFSMPSPENLEHLINFCKIMAGAPFYRNLGAGGIMAIYLTAKDHNVPFMACLNGGMYTFDGKVTFSAQLINAMIVNAGHTADLIHLDERKCVIHFKRGDRKNDPDYQGLIYEYTIENAAVAGYLKKDNWKHSPKDMLFSRCLTGGGRKHIPEIFVGVLVTGELVGTISDGQTPAQVPMQTTQIEIKEPPKQITFEKVPNYEKFLDKYFMEHGSIVYDYVDVICKKANMEKVQVWNSAIKNEELFLTQFKNWKSNLKETDEITS